MLDSCIYGANHFLSCCFIGKREKSANVFWITYKFVRVLSYSVPKVQEYLVLRCNIHTSYKQDSGSFKISGQQAFYKDVHTGFMSISEFPQGTVLWMRLIQRHPLTQ